MRSNFLWNKICMEICMQTILKQVKAYSKWMNRIGTATKHETFNFLYQLAINDKECIKLFHLYTIQYTQTQVILAGIKFLYSD